MISCSTCGWRMFRLLPRAGEVEVVARVVLHRAVVGVVVDAAHRQHRPEVVALGGVVVDHVEDHLDAGRVQRLDHRLELLDLAERDRRRVAVVRGEVGDRVVAPVVAQAAFDEVVVVDELVHRHQLDGGDAEALEVVDDRRVGEARVGAAQRRRHVGVLHREPAHVGLVDDRLVRAARRAGGRCPSRRSGRRRPPWGRAGAVSSVFGSVGVVEVVAEARPRPVDVAGDRLGVRVEQQLGRVAPQALGGLPRSVDPVAVALAGADVGEVDVPAVAVDLGQLDPLLFDRAVVPGVAGAAVGAVVVAEQAQLDTVGDAGEQREIGARAVVVGAERVRVAHPGTSGGTSGLLHEGSTLTPPVTGAKRRSSPGPGVPSATTRSVSERDCVGSVLGTAMA